MDFVLIFCYVSLFAHLGKDITSLAELCALQKHTRFATMSRQVTKVANDIAKFLFDRSMRVECNMFGDNRDAVFNVCEKAIDVS